MPGRALFMLQEIREAPEVTARLLDREWPRIRALAARLRRSDPVAVCLAARGSSDNAAVYGKYVLEARLGLPVALAAPSVITLLGGRPRSSRTVTIGISQSGESPDIVAVLNAARAHGGLTVAITNRSRSPLARAAHEAILTHAGDERSVAATKTYLAQLLALALLAAAWARDAGMPRDAAALPDAQSEVLAQEEEFARVAQHYRRMRTCIVAARGYDFATARELALKLMETSYVAALPLSSADLLHGPIALVGHDFPVLLLAPPGPAFGHLVTVARRLRAKRAQTAIFSSESQILRLARTPVRIAPRIAGMLAPLVYGVGVQLLAYHLSRAKGINPDRPRGLRKVTRTF